jgi:hypothetical protein
VAKSTVPAAGSLYAGVRATVTRVPGKDYGFVSLSTKRWDHPWNEWDSICPAIRVDMVDVATTREALESLARAILEASEDL